MQNSTRNIGASRASVMSAALCLVLAACSAGAGATASPPATEPAGQTPTNVPGTTAPGGTINLGALLPITGGGATYGAGMASAAELTVKEINDAGGVLGRTVSLVVEDSQTQANAGVTAAQKLINVNQVAAIVGPWSSAVTLAVAPIAIESEVVIICTSGSDDITGLDDNDYVWRTNPRGGIYGRVLAEVANRKGWKTAVSLIQNQPAYNTQASEFAAAFGGEVLALIKYNAEATDFSTEMREALSYDPDGFMLGAYTPDAALMFQAAYAQHRTDGSWVGNNVGINMKTVEAAGPDVAQGAMVGVTATDGYVALNSEGYKAFNAAFKETTGAELETNFYAAQIHDSLVAIALAMQSAGSSDAADWKSHLRTINSPDGEVVTSFAEGIAALQAGKKINYEGASGNVDWDEHGDVITDFVLLQFNGTAFEQVGFIEASLLAK